jgi:uncharacterized protein YecE (DUF72 family)
VDLHWYVKGNAREISILSQGSRNYYSSQANENRPEKILERIPRPIGSSSSDLPSSSSSSSIEATINDGYDYAVGFRHPFWKTEGPWELLRHYNIAAVLTDSPVCENLGFLSEVAITADHSFIRFHGRNEKGHYWYNYLYSRDELKLWAYKVAKLREQTKILRIYFNNHYGGKAIVNELQFKEMSIYMLTT